MPERLTRLTRRSFLRGAAATTAATLGAPYVLTSGALGAAGGPAASDRITLGILGTGGRAGEFLKLYPILAVCDVDAERRQAAKARAEAAGANTGVAAYNDFREVLARADVDAVVIAAPDHWHCPMSMAAARAGKDVYCEKPLSSYLGEGRMLVETIRRCGTVFQCGSQQRSDANFRLACELVRNGRIGRLEAIRVDIPGGKASGPAPPEPVPPGLDYDLWLGPAAWNYYTSQRCHYNFRFQLDYAAGKLSDWGAHHLDIAQWAMGADRTGPVEIEGRGVFPTEGIFDAATDFEFTCRYADGVLLHGRSREPNGILFQGTEGSVYVDRSRLETKPASLRFSRIRPDEVHLYRSDNHWQNFIRCVQTRQEPVAPAEVAHRSVSICHLVNVAMLLRRKVNWDPQAERFIGDDEADRMLQRARREPWCSLYA